MALSLGSHQRALLAGESHNRANMLTEALEERIDDELKRRRRTKMMLDPKAITESLRFLLRHDRKLSRIIATPELVEEMQDSIRMRSLSTKPKGKR